MLRKLLKVGWLMSFAICLTKLVLIGLEDNWTGRQKGQWCKAHAGPGRHSYNQCTESMFSELQDATFTLGKTTRDLSNFIPALGNYIKFKSESKVKNTFPLEPVVTRDMWKNASTHHADGHVNNKAGSRHV